MSWGSALLFGAVAVLAGSLFTALVYYAGAASSWALEDRRVSGFLLVFGLALAGGTPALLVFAVLLKWLTRGAARAAPWLLAGGVLGFAVPWTLARIGYAVERMYFPGDLQRLKAALVFPLMGPMMFDVQPAWVGVGIGVATAVPLWLVFRRTSRRRVVPGARS
jgi:hypothetical protein